MSLIHYIGEVLISSKFDQKCIILVPVEKSNLDEINILVPVKNPTLMKLIRLL